MDLEPTLVVSLLCQPGKWMKNIWLPKKLWSLNQKKYSSFPSGWYINFFFQPKSLHTSSSKLWDCKNKNKIQIQTIHQRVDQFHQIKFPSGITGRLGTPQRIFWNWNCLTRLICSTSAHGKTSDCAYSLDTDTALLIPIPHKLFQIRDISE